MNYKDIIVPYLDNLEERVEVFRKDFWNNTIPVEIEEIIELKLKISLAPILGFWKLTKMDALITSNWRCIYVDYEKYMRCDNRLRFSLAHEIGHYVMHRQIYNNFGIKTLEDYRKLYKDIPTRQYGYLEVQANRFASHLLIPRKVLAIEMEKELKNKNDPRIEKIDRQKLNSYLAIPLAKKFKVSEEALEIALKDIML